MMKDVGYGDEYQYAHDFKESTTDMETFPERFKGRRYYEPGDLGREKEIRKRMEWWQSLKSKLKSLNMITPAYQYETSD